MSWYTWFQHILGRPRGLESASSPEPPATSEFPTAPPIPLGEGDMRLLVGVVSTVGHYREHNEDNFFVPGRPSPHRQGITPPDEPVGPTGLFIVADGMGGQLAGEEASKMAVEIIPRELRERLDSAEDQRAIVAAIRESVGEANKEILAQSHLMTEFANMGTTVVLCLFQKGHVFIAGIGDSRAYRLREGRLEQLTTDHSLARALVDAGTITPEEEETHKFKNVLYLYLGSKDARGGPEQVEVLDIRVGDRFLLASDGLTGWVKDDQILALLANHDDPQQTAQMLVDRALGNASKDNVTCAVIHVVGVG